MNAVTSAPGTLSRLRDELGTWNALLYVASRLLERISGRRARLVKYYIVVQPIRPAAPLRPDPKTDIRFTYRDDVLVLDFPRPAPVVEGRYASGSHCLTATVDGRFAGFLWWQHGRYEEDEVRCTYVLADAEQAVWDYDVYVEPHFRFGRTLARLWQAANDHLRGKGIAWTFSRISAFNPASLSSHARLGMKARHGATFWVFGRLQIGFFDIPPYIHVSLSDTRRPVLRLSLPRGTEP